MVVAHPGVSLTQLQAAFGQSPAAALAQPIAALSLTRITLSAPPQVHAINLRP